MYHSSLLQNAGAPRVLRAAAAASTAPIQAKIYAKIVLRNLERHHELSRRKQAPSSYFLNQNCSFSVQKFTTRHLVLSSLMDYLWPNITKREKGSRK
ncbi:hypothetical protein V6N11_051615 [Hibiscus sabdariffa]|uniref:Uncharacterized protein n=1 Tax=Hibiscus sabdariffa TaxID=183260 RepID=A0ABR2U7N0_9ROSI